MFEPYRDKSFFLMPQNRRSLSLRSYCRKHDRKDYYLLKSIPGIGGYLAVALVAEFGEIRRFSKEKSFASYIGMAPMMCSSGGFRHYAMVSRSAAQLYYAKCLGGIADRSAGAGLLPHAYRQELKKHHRQDSKKLLNRILSVIKTETPYQNNYQKPLGMT